MPYLKSFDAEGSTDKFTNLDKYDGSGEGISNRVLHRMFLHITGRRSVYQL